MYAALLFAMPLGLGDCFHHRQAVGGRAFAPTREQAAEIRAPADML